MSTYVYVLFNIRGSRKQVNPLNRIVSKKDLSRDIAISIINPVSFCTQA
jgi:hypothetical protein